MTRRCSGGGAPLSELSLVTISTLYIEGPPCKPTAGTSAERPDGSSCRRGAYVSNVTPRAAQRQAVNQNYCTSVRQSPTELGMGACWRGGPGELSGGADQGSREARRLLHTARACRKLRLAELEDELEEVIERITPHADLVDPGNDSEL